GLLEHDPAFAEEYPALCKIPRGEPAVGPQSARSGLPRSFNGQIGSEPRFGKPLWHYLSSKIGPEIGARLDFPAIFVKTRNKGVFQRYVRLKPFTAPHRSAFDPLSFSANHHPSV